MVFLDSGAVSRLAERTRWSAALIGALKAEGLWPPKVPAAVLVECLTGNPGFDVPANRLLNTCEITEDLPQFLARRAARLRTQAGAGSAVDAIVVASAEPAGTVLTTDAGDLEALAAYAIGVSVERV